MGHRGPGTVGQERRCSKRLTMSYMRYGDFRHNFENRRLLSPEIAALAMSMAVVFAIVEEQVE